MAKSVANQLIKILDEEMSSHLSNVAIGSKKLILDRFDREEDVDGEDFAKLKDSTRKERRSKGYGGSHPILKRTSKLRNSIEVTSNFKSMTTKIDSVDYGYYLNDGRDNMDARRIIEFPKEWHIGGIESIKSKSKANKRIEERFIDFIDIYKNAER